MAIGFWMNSMYCYGCKTCSIACKSEKQLDRGVLLRTVTEIRQDDPAAFAFLSMACNHCEEPACVEMCPVGAYTKLEDGTVMQDHTVCIGCKTCSSARPFEVPQYVEIEGGGFRMDKCDTCLSLGRTADELPHCVLTCPTEALHFGTLADMEKLAGAKGGTRMEGETTPSVYVS